MTTVVPMGHCMLCSQWCLISSSPSNSVHSVMLDMPQIRVFPRPENILNVGTTTEAVVAGDLLFVYMKHLKTVHLLYFSGGMLFHR